MARDDHPILPRDVERSQGDPTGRPDTGAGLREFIDEHKLPPMAAAQQAPGTPLLDHARAPVEAGYRYAPAQFVTTPPPTYLWVLYDPRGQLVRTYLPEELEIARTAARQLRGLLAPLQAEDFRDRDRPQVPRHS